MTMETSARTSSTRDETKQTIHFATTFQQPLHALRGGQPVTLLASGDVEGMSPSFQCVDQQGKSQWVAASEITIYDPRALPAGADPQKVYQSSGTNGSRSSR